MSRPASQVPFERRRPIPPLGSADEVKRAVVFPYAIRMMVAMMAISAVFFIAMTAYAWATRGHQNMVVYTVFMGAYFAYFFAATKVAPPIITRRFYDRVMRGGLLCDVYPAGFPDAKAAILIDARLSDAQAARVQHTIVSWLGWLAENPSAAAQAGDLFADGPIRGADELAGPGAGGGFLVARDKNPYQGWRLILPAKNPRDPHRPYSNGLVVQVDTPSPVSAGQ
ncbi:hypothetical protein [Mycolicibacterium sp. HK-90]|uniref:hypothetical protein n=1 Tax=Mycolicibacterium sp. HK-90 TaxID=3056937 RepID=UPI002658F0A5|nr:hypothetical protein [Mycolicibacterium sp. HK-90]WKG05846.1 hypothetical protein QU592_12530 [Mycolicibacterium sp. HK-90]